jgi:hypothetical protein
MISLSNLSFEETIEKERKYDLDIITRDAMGRIGYAPVNFDSDNKKQAKATAKHLLIFFHHKSFEIYWRKSSTRRGYHFTVFQNGRQLFLPAQISIAIREQAGDCYGRLKADKQRIEHGLPIGVLFNGKNGKEATAWRKLVTVKSLK